LVRKFRRKRQSRASQNFCGIARPVSYGSMKDYHCIAHHQDNLEKI
jgi:hypothetical protein